MKNWMHTKGWEKLCFQDRDHQAHVKAYWDARFAIAAAKAPKFIKEFDPRGCNNAPAFRYPSFEEDPTAYFGGD